MWGLGSRVLRFRGFGVRGLVNLMLVGARFWHFTSRFVLHVYSLAETLAGKTHYATGSSVFMLGSRGVLFTNLFPRLLKGQPSVVWNPTWKDL